MNLGIVASFVIGGLLLISLLTLNSRVIDDSTKSTVDLVNKQYLDGIRQLVNYDFSRIGFGDNSEIKSFSSRKIEFDANIDGTGTKTVIWEFKNGTPVSSTKNPNDYKLVRTIKNGAATESEIQFNIIDFKLTGYKRPAPGPNGIGNETTAYEEVKSILVEIVYQSAEPTGKTGDGTDIYTSSRWRKYIVPNNLQFKTVIAK